MSHPAFVSVTISAFAFLLAGAVPTSSSQAAAAQSVVGVWKVVSWVNEDAQTGKREALYGERPGGVMVLTPEGRMVVLLTGQGRAPPRTDADRTAAFNSMIAYSGRYSIAGDRIIPKVDAAWNEEWVGTEQPRRFRFEGNRLLIETEVRPNVNFGNRMMKGVIIYERET